MSVLPISRKRPPGASTRKEASTNSPASEFSTTSTPGKEFSKSRVRDEAMRSSGTPSARTTGHLAGPAVAHTSAPKWCASCTAAMPTPPAAA